MVGVILAAGKGSRMHPNTLGASKPLLPIYDKPNIYYSLSLLIDTGCKEISIVCNPENIGPISKLFGGGSFLGVHINYDIQDTLDGIVGGLMRASCCYLDSEDAIVLALADNIFHGKHWSTTLSQLVEISEKHSSIAAIPVMWNSHPEKYGVAEIAKDSLKGFNSVISLEEKPQNPKSNYIVPGLYILPHNVATATAPFVEKSVRGEREITTLLSMYLEDDRLIAYDLGRDTRWFDTGSARDLQEAASYVEHAQKRDYPSTVVGSPELSALNRGFIDESQFRELVENYPASDYQTLLLDHKVYAAGKGAND